MDNQILSNHRMLASDGPAHVSRDAGAAPLPFSRDLAWNQPEGVSTL